MTERPQAGLSPARQAWRRLRRNHLAMAGLLVTAVVVLLVVAAPLASRHDPSLQRQWLGAQGPGFSHPDVLARNAFLLGETPHTVPLPAGAARLEIVADETVWRRFTIVWSRRQEAVRAIRETVIADQQTQFLNHDELEVPAGTAARIVTGPGNYQAWQTPLHLRLDEPAPPGFFYNIPNSVELEIASQHRKVLYSIGLDRDGQVSELRRDGEAIAGPLVIDGFLVAEARLDGEPLLATHLLGTDTVGRDLWARILYGGRISLLVGIVATVVSLLIGVVYGATSGYLGGRVDRGMMAGVDILYGLPFMFLVILLLSFFGSSLLLLFAALGAVQWLTMARIVRGQTLSLRSREFIDAARLCGGSGWSIIRGHIIPNSLGVIIVYTTLTVPIVILEESFLAFLGLSVTFADGQVGSWGMLVKDGMDALGTGGERSWLLIWPSLVMSLTLLGMNALGDGLRDAFDPRGPGPAA